VRLISVDGSLQIPAADRRFCDVRFTSLSNLVTIPPGPHLLSDLLATSPILAGEGGMGGGGAAGMDQDGDFGAGGGGGGGGDFGLDPNMDPELAMVR